MKALSLVGVRSAKASRKAKNRRFVPEDPSGGSPARLEGRALAAPAFWRFPYGDFREANDNTWSTGVDGTNAGEFSSNSSLNQLVGPVTWTGATTTDITDVGDPAPPASPVGAEAVSMGATSDLTWSGPFAGAGELTQFGGTRSYQIANNGTVSTSGWSVLETLQVSYAGPTPAELTSDRQIGFQLNFNTPGMQVVLDGTYTLNTFQIDGFDGGVGLSGSFTTAGGTQVTYSTGSSEVNFTVRTPLGTIPGATTNPVSGIGWGVTYNGTMGFGTRFLVPGVTSINQNFSMSYSTTFSNV